MPSTVKRTKLGFTRLTKERGANAPAGLLLQDAGGKDWAIWFDTSGGLRTAEAAVIEAANFNPETSGGLVGQQIPPVGMGAEGGTQSGTQSEPQSEPPPQEPQP